MSIPCTPSPTCFMAGCPAAAPAPAPTSVPAAAAPPPPPPSCSSLAFISATMLVRLMMASSSSSVGMRPASFLKILRVHQSTHKHTLRLCTCTHLGPCRVRGCTCGTCMISIEQAVRALGRLGACDTCCCMSCAVARAAHELPLERCNRHSDKHCKCQMQHCRRQMERCNRHSDEHCKCQVQHCRWQMKRCTWHKGEHCKCQVQRCRSTADAKWWARASTGCGVRSACQTSETHQPNPPFAYDRNPAHPSACWGLGRRVQACKEQ